MRNGLLIWVTRARGGSRPRGTGVSVGARRWDGRSSVSRVSSGGFSSMLMCKWKQIYNIQHCAMFISYPLAWELLDEFEARCTEH